MSSSSDDDDEDDVAVTEFGENAETQSACSRVSFRCAVKDVMRLRSLMVKKVRSEVVEPASKAQQRTLKESRDILKDVLSAQGDGNFLRGWRRELDPHGNFEVDFQDFAKCAQKLKFEVNTEMLFGLDDDHSSLTLEELSPPEGLLMNRIKFEISKRFESTSDMFARFDVDKKGELDLETFIKGFRATGIEATDDELTQVFECADVGNIGSLQEDDVIFLEYDEETRAKKTYQARMCRMDRWKYIAAHEYMEHIKKHKEAMEQGVRLTRSRRDPRPWLDKMFEQLPAVAWYTKQERHQSNAKNAAAAVASFKKHLQELYGDEIRAFRRALDHNGTYSFTFKTLRRYILKHNLHIPVYDLMRGLDRDNDGLVRIEDLSVKHAFALSSLRNWARKELRSCAAIWESEKAIVASRERTGTWFSDRKMLTSVFVDILGRLGWEDVNHKQTRVLAIGALDCFGCGVITKADLEWLDKWQPFEWICADPDPDALDEFKDRLERVYGHPLTAWRKALDTNDENRVSWPGFLAACKKHRFPKAGAAWRALDQDCLGAISLQQFEPEGAELLRSFKEWAEVHFGSIKRCWRAIDTDGAGHVSLGELKRACIKLNWTGDIRLLFDSLDIDGQVHGEYLARYLTPNEVAFLDSWHFGSVDATATSDELMRTRRSSRLSTAVGRRKREQRAAEIAAITARLSTPYGCPLPPEASLSATFSMAPRGSKRLDTNHLPSLTSHVDSKWGATRGLDFGTYSRSSPTGKRLGSAGGKMTKSAHSMSAPTLRKAVDELLMEESYL